MTIRHCEQSLAMGSDFGMKTFNSNENFQLKQPTREFNTISPFTASPSTKPPAIPSSEPVIHGASSVLKRKVFYEFIGEAINVIIHFATE